MGFNSGFKGLMNRIKLRHIPEDNNLRENLKRHIINNSALRRCATSRNIAVSLPDVIIGIFNWHNPSGRIMTLGSTQPITEMSISNVSWGVKAARCVGLTTLPPSCGVYQEILGAWTFCSTKFLFKSAMGELHHVAIQSNLHIVWLFRIIT